MPKICGRELTEAQYRGAELIYGDLNLNKLTTIPKGFSPVVEHNIYMNNIKILPPKFKLEAKRSIFLKGVKKVVEKSSIIAGGDVVLNFPTHVSPKSKIVAGALVRNLSPEHKFQSVFGLVNKDKFVSCPDNLIPRNLVSKGYCYVDNNLIFVLEQKKDAYKVKVAGDPDISFIISYRGLFSHERTFVGAKADILFQLNKPELSSYSNLSRNNVLLLNDAVFCYRLVTKASTSEVLDFLNNHLKEKYTISDMCYFSKGYYGHDLFNKYFSR